MRIFASTFAKASAAVLALFILWAGLHAAKGQGSLNRGGERGVVTLNEQIGGDHTQDYDAVARSWLETEYLGVEIHVSETDQARVALSFEHKTLSESGRTVCAVAIIRVRPIEEGATIREGFVENLEARRIICAWLKPDEDARLDRNPLYVPAQAEAPKVPRKVLPYGGNAICFQYLYLAADALEAEGANAQPVVGGVVGEGDLFLFWRGEDGAVFATITTGSGVTCILSSSRNGVDGFLDGQEARRRIEDSRRAAGASL